MDDARGCIEVIRQSMPKSVYSALDGFHLAAFGMAWAIHKKAALEISNPDFNWTVADTVAMAEGSERTGNHHCKPRRSARSRSEESRCTQTTRRKAEAKQVRRTHRASRVRAIEPLNQSVMIDCAMGGAGSQSIEECRKGSVTKDAAN